MAKRPLWVRLVRDSSVPRYDADKSPLRGPRDVAKFFAWLRDELVENFVVVGLNAQHVPIFAHVVSRGIINSTLVHPREVFRLAISEGAASIILGHNHPSGCVTPSPDDITITRQLIKAGKILDIPVHDHVIVGGQDAQYSMAEHGQMYEV